MEYVYMRACICVIVRVPDFAEDIELNALKDLPSFHLGTDCEGQGSLWILDLIFNCLVLCLSLFFVISFQMKNFRGLSPLHKDDPQLWSKFKYLTFSLFSNFWDVNMELNSRLTNALGEMKDTSI